MNQDVHHPNPQESLQQDIDYDADTLYRLGLTRRTQGYHEEAAAIFKQALEKEPGRGDIHNSLACALMTLGRWEEAREVCDQGLQVTPDHAEMWDNLGVIFGIGGEFLRANTCFSKAVELNPENMTAWEHLDYCFENVVPYWHFSMMNDQVRNDAYEAAIQRAVKPHHHVLDIGTGAGLLAMMAARAGAHQVTTTEMVAPVAQVAGKIIAENGYADRITVYNKKSDQLVLGEDMPERADILVTEIFDAIFLGEDAVPTIEHARRHLLKENATVIPRAGTVFACLIESPALWHECAVTSTSGFDLRLFNQFRDSKSGKYVRNFPYRRLSGDVPVFDFDFMGQPISPESKQMEIEVREQGTLHHLVIWFRLHLDEHTFLDTNIETSSCWRQGLQLVYPPRLVSAGEKVRFKAMHNGRWIKLRMENPV